MFKKLDSLNKSLEPFLFDFKNSIEPKRQIIANPKAAVGMVHSPAHFIELKNMLIQEITATNEKIQTVIKNTLENEKNVSKLKLEMVFSKYDPFLDEMIKFSKENISKEKTTFLLREEQYNKYISDFELECENLRSKMHTNLELFLDSHKAKNKKESIIFKSIIYIFTYIGGILSTITTQIILENRNEIWSLLRSLI